MSEDKLAKIDVKESTRNRLQLYKQKHREDFRNVNQIIDKWLTEAEKKDNNKK